ncbi:MAG TPA: hypothetical protein VG710_02655 [Opitutus sp.]|nr:hypothetical protein [Opitutus sp.]
MPFAAAKRAGVRLAILSVVLFLSGASALVLQTLWLRLTGLEFGNSVWSAALILSSFMAGLALGNGIAARARLPLGSALRVYAGLELAVAVVGGAIVFVVPHLGAALRPLFQALWEHQIGLTVLRLGLVFLILLVPSTAMGLTLPVLLEDAGLRRYPFGRTVGVLYGWNTLGAVVGVLSGELFLFKAVGLIGAAATAGAMSGLAALIAWQLGGSKVCDGEIDPAPATSPAPANPAESPALWRLLSCAFGCGLILLCLEIVWLRFLRLYLAPSAASFAIMLAVVLAGIGIGGLVSGLLHRRSLEPARLLASLLMTAAILTLVSYASFPIPANANAESAFNVEHGSQIALLSVALMLPVALVSGVLFPAVTAGVQSALPGRMNSAGAATLCNTLGAALGPLLTAFVLLPRIGFQSSLVGCALGYGVLALIVSTRRHWSFRRLEGVTLLPLCAIVIVALIFFPYGRDRRHFANARRPYEADGSQLVRRVEGTADTLQVLRRDLFGRPYYHRLVTNNYSMSSTHPRSQRYMRLFAYLPLALRPESTDALLICYGVGVTADALTHDRTLQHIDVVDISKEVLGLASEYVQPGASNPLRDPRVTTFVQDGRFYLQACPRRYDLITGEPPPLKTAGTVNLYTREFFSLMRSRLKDGGVASFWLPIYQLKVAETKAILRAFHEAFPNASVWGGADGEWIMLGVNGPGRRLSEPELRRWWEDPVTHPDLVRIGLETPGQLAACFLMDGDGIARLTADAAPLTDLRPKRLGDVFPEPAEVRDFAWTFLEGDPAWRRFMNSRMIARIWPQPAKATLEPFFVLRETSYLLETKGGNWLAALDFYLRGTRLRRPVEDVLHTDETRIELAGLAANGRSAPPAAALPDLIAGELAGRNFTRAIRLLETEQASASRTANDFFLLVYLYCLTGRTDEAEALAARTPLQHDWFVDWLWQKLHADFGFRPPA